MPTELLNLLVQVPIVALFAWYVMRRDELDRTSREKRDGQWMTFLREQRAGMEEFMRGVSASLDRVTERLTAVEHALTTSMHCTDEITSNIREAVAAMRDAVTMMRAVLGTRLNDHATMTTTSQPR